MKNEKKKWITPRLRRIEPTAELLALFAAQLEARDPRPAPRLKRTG